MELSEREETNYFRAVFDHCAVKDPSGASTSVSKDTLVALMKASGVASKILGNIYTKWNLNNHQAISFELFLEVLRDITLVFNGVNLPTGPSKERPMNLGKRRPVVFSEFPIHPSQFQQPMGRKDSGAPGQPVVGPTISAEQVATYLQIIRTKKQGKEPPYVVDFSEAKTFFGDFGIPTAALKLIWNLCDQKGKGSLTEPEIILSLYLIEQAKKDENVPGELPESLKAFVQGYSRSRTSTANNSFSEIEKGPANPNSSMIRLNESKVGPKPVSAQATSLFGLADSNKPSPTPSPVQADKHASQRTLPYQATPASPPTPSSVSQRTVPTQQSAGNGDSDPNKVNFNIFGGFNTPEINMNGFGFNNVAIQSNPQPTPPSSENLGGKDAFGFERTPPQNPGPVQAPPKPTQPTQSVPAPPKTQPAPPTPETRPEQPQPKVDSPPSPAPVPPLPQEAPKPKLPVYQPTFDEAKDLVELTQALELLTKEEAAGVEESHRRIAHLETQNFQTREKIVDLVKQINRETEKSHQLLESLHHRISGQNSDLDPSQLALLKAPSDLQALLKELGHGSIHLDALADLVNETLRHNEELKKEAAEAALKMAQSPTSIPGEAPEAAQTPEVEEEPADGKFAGLTQILVDKGADSGPKFSGDFDF